MQKLKAKYFLLLSCIMMVALITTGCWDKLEVEEQAYVIAVGIDKTQQKGIYEITYQVANPQGGSGSATGDKAEEPPDQTITIKVPGIIAGKDTANAIISRRLNFYHMNYIIVSEELARTDEFFPLVESLIRDREISRKSTLIISREKASAFLNAEKSKTETRRHKY